MCAYFAHYFLFFCSHLIVSWYLTVLNHLMCNLHFNSCTSVNDKPVNKSIGSQATSTTFVMRQSEWCAASVSDDSTDALSLCPRQMSQFHFNLFVCVYLYSSLCAFSHTNWSVNKYVTMSIVYTRFFFTTKYAKTSKSKRFIQKPIAINRFFFHSIPEN